MSLIYIAQQSTIYGGIFLFVIGVIGNLLNIIIFSTTREYRQTVSSFLFLVNSIDSLIHILFSLTLRILSVGFGIDLARKSLIICRMRSYFITTLTLISLSCSSLAAIDQFLFTSRSQKLRELSHMKQAYRVVFIMILLWIAHGIPYLIFYEISSTTGTCINTNSIYANYLTVGAFLFLFIIPVFILIFFGYLSYPNIHRIRILSEQHADRQLTQMMLMQAALVCLSTAPYTILNVFSVATTRVIKDLDQQMKEYLIAAITNLISYFHFVVNLFI